MALNSTSHPQDASVDVEPVFLMSRGLDNQLRSRNDVKEDIRVLELVSQVLQYRVFERNRSPPPDVPAATSLISDFFTSNRVQRLKVSSGRCSHEKKKQQHRTGLDICDSKLIHQRLRHFVINYQA
ncbi:hypothetical protein RRG08_050932 [Elysia crispata]|uniref:Uncharacterized protein n=1 Tax=Elysia crispata TaxID=231223 RepID=A0AAE0YRG8_9GAST|nr:hypothetical protein RRG08_050932 [Elysia crispata]